MISLEQTTIQLKIEGEPGVELTIRYRGNSDEDEAPSPVVYEGAIEAAGSVTVIVPRIYLVILSRHGTLPLRMHEETGSNKTVKLLESE